jgi:hypothetical protein
VSAGAGAAVPSGGLPAGSGDLAETLAAGVEESVEDDAGQHEDQGLVNGLVAGGDGVALDQPADHVFGVSAGPVIVPYGGRDDAEGG